MILSSESLPSNGNYTASKTIELKPLTYREIKEYDRYEVHNSVQKYIRDIDLLITRIPNWESLLLYDLDPLIFTIKYISVVDNKNIKLNLDCNNCGKFETEFNIGELDFIKLDDEILKYKGVTLNGHLYSFSHLTTIREFRNLLSDLMKFKVDFDKEELYLMALLYDTTNLNQIYDDIQNASRTDIAIISYLSKVLSSSTKPITFKCPHCGKEVVVKLDNLITDLFQCIIYNTQVGFNNIIIE